MELKTIRIDEIQPNPFQPRENFEKEYLLELADSMKEFNLIQPIVVRHKERGYQIIAGERRWRAAQIAGFKEIPCIVKDVSEERVLLESLAENLHRMDLTDVERENAIHQLWENRKTLGLSSKTELAKALGVLEARVSEAIEAWEFRHEESLHGEVSTRAIRATRGLETHERKKILDKVSADELKVSELDVVASVIKKASEPIKQELLKPKSLITPKMAKTMVEKLSNEEEQIIVLDEVKRFRLTEDEVENRIREIQHAREKGKPLKKEMGVQEGTIYTVGEYECPNCKKHYLLKCNGKRDWVE